LRFSTLCGLRNSRKSRSDAAHAIQQQQQQQQHWPQGMSQPLVAMAMRGDLNAAEESTQHKEPTEVATNPPTYTGNEKVQCCCTQEELGRQEIASEAFLRTSADINVSALDIAAGDGSVSAPPIAVHATPADITAAATDAATVPPSLGVPRLIRSLSSPAVLCHRDQVEGPVVPACTPRPHLERTTSIGCPGEFQLQRNGSTLRELDSVRDRENCAGPVAAQGSQALRVMPLNYGEAAGVARETAPRDVEAASLRLSRDFEELAAEALELGCSRVPGGMDVFEQANAAMERIASCLRHCREVQASAKGSWPPTLTDAAAKGPVVQAVGGG
jgi:hypothetical protein